MGKIKWSLKASVNLRCIYDYIAADSVIYAARFIKSLIKATKKLAIMPQCGRIVQELVDYGLREVIYQNYRIVYRIVGVQKDIEILAALHGVRKIKEAFLRDWEMRYCLGVK